MTLPASPPITMANVRAEFGGTAGTTKLSAYVRGGAYVPNIAANSGVPTSVPIRLNQLCGATKTTGSALAVSLSTGYVNKISATPATLTTAAVTATATGGSGTKTYAWTRVSGDTGITATSSSSATTAFSGTVNKTTPIRDAVFRCTVTDASGSAYADVSVHLEYSP